MVSELINFSEYFKHTHRNTHLQHSPETTQDNSDCQSDETSPNNQNHEDTVAVAGNNLATYFDERIQIPDSDNVSEFNLLKFNNNANVANLSGEFQLQETMGLLRPWIFNVHSLLGPGKYRKRLAMRHDRGISAFVGAALGHHFGAVDAEAVRQIR